jgi:hypothetical protein
MTTTMKERTFIANSVGDKDVNILPGIGPKYTEMFHQAGIYKVEMCRRLIRHRLLICQTYRVIGRYLWHNKDQALFMEWLKRRIGITNPGAIRKLHECVDNWCRHHV